MKTPRGGTPSMVRVSLAGSALSVIGAAAPALAQPVGFPAVFELSSLLPENGGDGSLGFVINGIDASDYSGFSVASPGDVNGDGIGDIVIGAFSADPGGRSDAGETYVVFGRNTGFPASIQLSSLDGTTGFRLDGIDSDDSSGTCVASAGDVNGDGIVDLVIGAFSADPGGRSDAGETYVVFGRSTAFPASIALSSLNGTTGFRIDGIDAEDDSGLSVASAGDVNGDAIADLLIGALRADPGGHFTAGETYVVFGRSTPFPASIALSSLDGTTGFRADGIDADDYSGASVAAAGDVNGDGIGDFVTGAHSADPGGRSRAGETYVVFGRTTGFPTSVELSGLDRDTGFRLDGIDAEDYSGLSVASAGDVNGDGIADLVIGAFRADPGGRSAAGETYVVFGRSPGFPDSIALSSLHGSTGFRLDGIAADDGSGMRVASAGDVNGDGIADLLIGAPYADVQGRSSAGETYVVFGRTTPFPASIALSSLDGVTGFRLEGIDAIDLSGFCVAPGGDVNGDGIADLIIGAHRADPGGRSNAGETYVVFGRGACRADWNNDQTLDAFDYDDFVTAYFKYLIAGTGFPDYNQDGYVDAFDYDDFVSDFFTGCG